LELLLISLDTLKPQTARRLLKPVLLVAVYLLAFVVLKWTLHEFEIQPGLAIWYPPAGLSVALLLACGLRYAPAVFVAALASDLWVHRGPLSPWLVALWAVATTLGYGVAVFCLRRRLAVNPRLTRYRDVFWFVLIVSITSFVLATVAVTGNPLVIIPGFGFSFTLLRWWVGELIGIITLTPFLLVCVAPLMSAIGDCIDGQRSWRHLFATWIARPSGWRILETAGQAVSIVIVLWLALGLHLGGNLQPLYLCFLPIIWIALRRGLPGATIGIALTNAGANFIFQRVGENPVAVAELQLFMLILSLTGLFLGVMVTESQRAQASLQAAEQRAINEYERLLDRLSNLAQKFGTARDLPTIFRALHEFTLASTPATGIFISVIDITMRRIVYGRCDGEEIEVSELPPMPLTDNPHSQAIRTNTIIITDDYKAAMAGLRVTPVGDEKLPGAMQSAMVVPMAVMGEVTGSIEAQSTEFAAFSGEHVTAMRMAANLAAVAIENVRLLEREHAREEELRQSQKMEAVGRLAGGVAHDFNNMLTAMLGYSDLLLSRPRLDNAMRTDLEEIKKAGERAASLTRQLLAFSRKQVLQPKVLNLNAVVADMEKMLLRLLAEDIDLVTVCDPALGSLKADPGQIEQVILNLALNSRDAMIEGGKLTIETANVDLQSSYTQQHKEILPGRYVMLAVSDTGCGMDAETRSHIFEPFFTTKPTGAGTGMGLATVYGIVKQSGSYILVYTEPGVGTTFKVFFPRIEAASETRPLAAERAELPLGSETILLVEDEDAVRHLARQVLEMQGYTVLEARNGLEALAVAEHQAGHIHLLLTDVVMPEMSGRALVESLRAIRPSIAVLYMSGYTDDAIVRQGVLEPGTAFLSKPFTLEILVRKVQEVLHTTRPQ
jgi:signal transduction histidine kinase/integral membrane sensor domain MASE1/ActR/RegA family two-component response regulator